MTDRRRGLLEQHKRGRSASVPRELGYAPDAVFESLSMDVGDTRVNFEEELRRREMRIRELERALEKKDTDIAALLAAVQRAKERSLISEEAYADMMNRLAIARQER